jgi:hypothetical protein
VPYFGDSPSEEAAKTGVIYKKYIPQLTEERMTLCLSVNRGVYEHVAGARGGSIFIDYV